MSDRYQLSHFTALLPGLDGEVLLVNSFMGGLARASARSADALMHAVDHGVTRDQLEPDLTFLIDSGYFVPEGLDELPAVRTLLQRERAAHGQELIIMPHENCNFRCVYCYETFARGKMQDSVVEGIKALVERRVEQWGRLHVSWFGGEPLLAKDVVLDLSDALTQTCRAAGVTYTSAMTTNGSLLTPGVAERLIDDQVRFFQVTVDGPAHEHDLRRHLAGGGSTYAQVMSNLEALHESALRFTVRLRVNYDPGSLAALTPWVRDELAPVFADDERFQLAFHPIGRWGGPHDEDLEVCSEADGWRVRNDLYRASAGSGFSTATFKSFLASHGTTCYAGRESSIVIGSDGRLYKCTVAFDDPRNHVGWLSQDGELDIDEEAFARWVRTDHLDTAKCDSCWFHASCQSRACPLVAMSDGAPPCPTQRAEMVEIVQIAAYGEHEHRWVAAEPAPVH